MENEDEYMTLGISGGRETTTDNNYARPAEDEIVMEALKKPLNEVLVRISGISVTAGDLRTLCDLNWLNDVIIDAYLNLIVC